METTMDTDEPLIADPSNDGQVGAWDGGEGAFWTTQARRFDETLANCHGPFLTAAAIREGDRVLDVGCGTGLATRDVARIAVNGSALGVDLSSQMIALARETAAADGLDNVEFRQADAQIHPFEDAEFDVVISRMGSMSSAIRSRHSPTSIARCAPAADSSSSPGRASPTTSGSPSSAPPWPSAAPSRHHSPTSPFALCDPDRVRAILDTAGFADVSFQSLHEPMSFGPDPDDAFDFVSGLTGWMREGLDETDRDAALAALRTTIAEHTGDHGVAYESATWIIQARKP
jgi:hypothetical protein